MLLIVRINSTLSPTVYGHDWFCGSTYFRIGSRFDYREQQSEKNEEIYRARLAAERDSLTGLYNRLAFEVVVTQRLQNQQGKLTGAFVMLDIDLFKQINDQYGHSYGDSVLSLLADKLRELFADHGALLCRMGGDEFALFFPNGLSKRI